MNAANILTSARILIVPFFIALMKFDSSITCRIIALLLFIIASITDAIDGIIARKFNLISNFGKFFDPLADKILVICAMICLVELNLLNSIFLSIIVSREFLITSIRLTTALKGKVIAANFLGKLKTVLQLIATTLILVCHTFSLNKFCFAFSNFIMIVATTITLISGIKYFIENRKYVF